MCRRSKRCLSSNQFHANTVSDYRSGVIPLRGVLRMFRVLYLFLTSRPDHNVFTSPAPAPTHHPRAHLHVYLSHPSHSSPISITRHPRVHPSPTSRPPKHHLHPSHITLTTILILTHTIIQDVQELLAAGVQPDEEKDIVSLLCLGLGP